MCTSGKGNCSVSSHSCGLEFRPCRKACGHATSSYLGGSMAMFATPFLHNTHNFEEPDGLLSICLS